MELTLLHNRNRLNIGLPVYNGEKYLEATLISLQEQTWQDYSLIISDNASTDRTEEICRSYAARDERIHYYRNEKNIGAVQNWYRVFELSSSEYFASVAHDDIYAPDYMQKCMEILDLDESIVLCYSKTKVIDENGNLIGAFDVEVDTTSPKPHERLYSVLATDYLCIQLYGVMRSHALKSTRVFAGYYGCDRNTLFELALLGPLYEIPEPMFFHRLYPDALGIAMNSGKSLDELLILDPGTDWRYRSTFMTIYRNYLASIARLVNPTSERVRCYQQLARVILQKINKRARRLIEKRSS
jgi:glycosyltransferase involved in cell wall biosynthesis